ncbi:MAG TPA: carboxypeptidase-like regulatory domain-containing protein, partial [Candidatus Sumerlaeia bacterium]|nr:carboxypeptidase-like regulatory domain-containing protein [Candidatus Sumerlaeia bacterium]
KNNLTTETVRRQRPRSADKKIASTPNLLRIFGTVRSEKGELLSGADIRATVIENLALGIQGDEAGRGATKKDGQYEIKVPHGKNYAVLARAKGHAAVQQIARSSGGKSKEIRLNFDLMREVSISGIVKNMKGEPLANAAISPSRQRPPEDKRWEAFLNEIPPDMLAVKSDSNGKFAINGLFSGVYALAASKEGFTPVVKKDIKAPAQNVEIIMLEGDGGIIAGGVYYFANGKAAEGATIEIRSEPFTARPLKARANALGEFRFENLTPGLFEISAEKDSMKSMPIAPIDLRRNLRKLDVALKIFDGYIISGKVFEQGKVKILPGARVTIRSHFNDEGISAESNEQGIYTITGIYNRSILIFAEMEGYFQTGNRGPGSPVQKQLPADKAEIKNADLIMTRGIPISGRVISAASSAPINGADVRFITDARVFLVNRQNMKTDVYGRFKGYVHNNSRLTVRASHADFSDASTNPIAVSEEPIDDIEIKMSAGGRISGVVLSPGESPAPVPNARVQGSAPSADVGGRGRTIGQKGAITDSQGRFFMEQIPAGEYYLTATAENYSASPRKTVRVPENGELADVQITLTAPHFIEGRVVNKDSEPVVGAEVIARGNNTQRGYSDADGIFRINNLGAGKFQVSARKGSESSNTVAAQADSTNVELVMNTRELASLHGRVVDSNTGEGVRRFTLRAERGRMNYGDFADSEGRFAIDNLVRGNTYRFLIDAAGYLTMLSPEVKIPQEGDPAEAIFPIGSGGSVFGRVVAASSKIPIEGAKVTWILARLPRASIGDQQVTFTNSQGLFLFENLAPDVYRLIFEKSGYPETMIETIAKSGEIQELGDILLKAGGAIRGVIYDAAEPANPAADMVIRLNSTNLMAAITMSYKTSADGVYQFPDLPEGKYNLAVIGGNYASQNGIEIRPGDARTIDFRPRKK